MRANVIQCFDKQGSFFSFGLDYFIERKVHVVLRLVFSNIQILHVLIKLNIYSNQNKYVNGSLVLDIL